MTTTHSIEAVKDGDETEEEVDPDHPASPQQCDHPNCTHDSPGVQRICDNCIPVMLASAPDECPYCGASIRD